MKALIIGDMHVVPEELEDCSALIQYVLSICQQNDLHEIWFMGDQHHTHNVLRVEVMNWWKIAFKALRAQGINSLCLVGNHDQVYPGSPVHSMQAYQNDGGVKIIDRPTLYKGVLLVPYIHDQNEFLEACKKYSAEEQPDFKPPAKTVVCHQTFDGSTYENGFLASDGFDVSQVPQELIISGHIHTGQEFSKVWYVGAPRWRTMSDANVPRSIWLVEFDNEGTLTNRIPFDTANVCRQILHRVDIPEAPLQLPLDPKHSWTVDIKGPPSWCQARKLELRAAGAKIRTFPTSTSTVGKVKESDGIDVAFKAFVKSYRPKNGTSLEKLEEMSKERIGV